MYVAVVNHHHGETTLTYTLNPQEVLDALLDSGLECELRDITRLPPDYVDFIEDARGTYAHVTWRKPPFEIVPANPLSQGPDFWSNDGERNFLWLAGINGAFTLRKHGGKYDVCMGYHGESSFKPTYEFVSEDMAYQFMEQYQ